MLFQLTKCMCFFSFSNNSLFQSAKCTSLQLAKKNNQTKNKINKMRSAHIIINCKDKVLHDPDWTPHLSTFLQINNGKNKTKMSLSISYLHPNLKKIHIIVNFSPSIYTLFWTDLSAFLAPLLSFSKLLGFLLKYITEAITTKSTTTHAATIPMIGPKFWWDRAT